MTDLFIGIHAIYDDAGNSATPYMTRAWIGRLRLHVFYRGDNDPDPHDHPWDFWTFPLSRHGYYEEALRVVPFDKPQGEWWCGKRYLPGDQYMRAQRVPGWRWSFRPAEHTHRVLYPAQCDFGFFKADTEHWLNDHSKALGAIQAQWPIVTIVWRGSSRRKWGFLKNRDGQWCWVGWRDYVFNGGKHAPCEPETSE